MPCSAHADAAGDGHAERASRANEPQRQKLAAQLRRWGVAGIAAYGVLNTLYYGVAIAIAWHFVLQVPRGIGLQAGCQKLAEAAVPSQVD